MKFLNREIELKDALQREWLITNGIGGYSSSTIVGANTRKYHGLLVAPLNPPANRYLILSKVDESIYIDGKKHILYTNLCKDYTSEGYKNLNSFEKDYLPVFKYNIQDIEITKTICMQHSRNTVCILYKIKNKDKKVKFSITPLLNFRDFHSISSGKKFNLREIIKNKKVKVVIDNNSVVPIYMNCSEGNYIEHKNDSFKNMFYIKEDERGFYPEENHCIPGRYDIEINENEEKEITFTCSLEENIDELDAKVVIDNEIKRIKNMINKTEIFKDYHIDRKSKDAKLIKDLIIATDNFIVYRPSFRLHTIIAGYPWFLDWGRDALIAFEGLLLVTKRYDIAKEVLYTFIRNIKYGLVPNGYSGFDSRPLYNSVDSSLLLFEQINKYLEYTNDYKFVKNDIFLILEKIIDSYIKGIDFDNNNIYLDDDNLIVSGTETTQNTWMDAKIDGVAITPRNGKAVEINALWYNALKTMENLSLEFKENEKVEKYKKMALATKKAFNKKFYNHPKRSLYDVLGDDKIRPNQLFSLSLTYPVLDPSCKNAEHIMKTVRMKLLNKYGLKTLAKNEKGYVDVYEGSPYKRDSSYHQGITWPWLLGLYSSAQKNMIKYEKRKTIKRQLEDEYNAFLLKIKNNYKKALYNDGAIGSISEIYDSVPPYKARGTIAQAWSVSEVLKIILEEKKVNGNENSRY